MAENNEKVVEKKENIFKRIVHSKKVEKGVQIGTTILTLLNTGLLFWAFFDPKSASAPVVTDSVENVEMEVTPGPDAEVVNF